MSDSTMILHRQIRHRAMETTGISCGPLSPANRRLDRYRGASHKGYPKPPVPGGPDRHTSWLATINRDGSPHVTGVGALWFDRPSGSSTGIDPQREDTACDPRVLVERCHARVRPCRRGRGRESHGSDSWLPQWQNGGARRDGQPEWMVPGSPSRPITAPRQPGLPHGRSSARARRESPSSRLSQEEPRCGDSIQFDLHFTDQQRPRRRGNSRSSHRPRRRSASSPWPPWLNPLRPRALNRRGSPWLANGARRRLRYSWRCPGQRSRDGQGRSRSHGRQRPR